MSKNNKFWWTVSLLLLTIILVGGALVWYFDVKFRDIEVNLGPGPEVRANPYLAVSKLMNQIHGENRFETQQGLKLLGNLPSTKDTIIIDARRESLTSEKATQIYNWVNQGGRLILLARPLVVDGWVARDDLLLKLFDIEFTPYALEEVEEAFEQLSRIRPPSKPKSIEQRIEQRNLELSYRCTYEEPATTVSVNQSDEFGVDVDSNDDLKYVGDGNALRFYGRNSKGRQVVQIANGKGVVTALTDLSLWQNELIACSDNVFFLNELIKGSQKVWLLYHEEMPGVMTLMWRHSANLILASLLMIFLWIWRSTLTMGPTMSETQRVRRNYLEHLSAAARFRWHNGQSEELIELLRQKVTRNVSLRHNDFQQMQRQQQVSLLSRLSGSTEQQIQQAMYSPVPGKTDAMVNLVQQLQTLRKQLC